MKTMTNLAKFGAGAIGAIALTFGAAGVAGAQDEAPTEDGATEEARSERSEARALKKAALADIVGLSVEELQEARQGGQSLADIAGENVDEVVSFLTDNAEARIAAKVEAGRITEEQAAERLENIDERVAERIANDEVRERGSRRGNRGDRNADTIDS